MQYVQSPPGWAINSALQYFNLPKDSLEEIKWGRGVRKLMDMWAVHGYGMYRSPWFALRQEWFHEILPMRRLPAFFANLPEDSVILDWGCGTGEVCRRDWIDQGGSIILADVPGPNFEYLKHKFRDRPNVTFWDAHKPVTVPYNALVCIDVLEHVINPMKTIKKLWDGLSYGGHALIWFDDTFPHPGHLEDSIKKKGEYEKWLVENSVDICSTDNFDWVIKPKPLTRRIYEFFRIGKEKRSQH